MTQALINSSWTAREAQIIIEFLDELKERIWSHYQGDLLKLYHLDESIHDQYGMTPLEEAEAFDDLIPF
jgi:hypothetical protein